MNLRGTFTLDPTKQPGLITLVTEDQPTRAGSSPASAQALRCSPATACEADDIEYFSRDLTNPLTGTIDWASYQTPFFFQKGERADRIRLNLVIAGSGTVWIRDIELLHGPLVK